MASTAVELMRRRMMGARGESVDWKSMYMSLISGTLQDVIVPDGVTALRSRIFQTSSVYSISLPSTLTRINNDACNSASGLQDITIPSSVAYIGINAFVWCSSLQWVIVESSTPPTLANSNAFNNTNNCPIYVPDSAVNDYKAAAQWSNLASRIFPISDLTT